MNSLSKCATTSSRTHVMFELDIGKLASQRNKLSDTVLSHWIESRDHNVGRGSTKEAAYQRDNVSVWCAVLGIVEERYTKLPW